MTHAVDVTETVWIPMPDGTRLAARLWLPRGAGPVPAILEYIPYRRRDRTRLRDESMHPHLAAAGYASIRVDIRGYGDSEGVAGDEYSVQEQQDGVAVVAWLSEQPWCDGAVGMFGKSWGAYNAFQVAALRPPALKAIAPVMGCDDRWLEDIHFYGGCLAGDNFWWGSIMQLYNAMPPDPEIVGDRWRDMWRDRLDAMAFWPAEWLEHQTRDGWWRRGSISEDYDAVQVPVHFFGGWADLFRDTPLRIAERLQDVRVTMGPWAHLYPHEGVPGPAMDFLGELIRFWDTHLKGIDTGLAREAPLRFYLQDSAPPSGTITHRGGTWVEEAAWPSPNVTMTAHQLGDGTLGGAPGGVLDIRSPHTFGQAGGDMCSFAIPGDLPVDGRIEAGGALSFRGAAQGAPLDLLGQPVLTVRLWADAPSAMIAALLYDEAPDGAQTLISRGFANLAQRNWTAEAEHEPDPVVPGEAMEVAVTLHGCGAQIAAGHRLVLQVGSTYWPVLWPQADAATLSVDTAASALSLPVRAPTGPAAHPPAAAPEAADPPRVTEMRSGSMDRSVATDLTTGVQTQRFFVDGGVFGPIGDVRLDDIGTVLSDVSERLYAIHPDDPLSAVATMIQEAGFARGDWRVRIVTTARQTATATDFHLTATTTSYDGDAAFHEKKWDRSIPRRGH